MFLSRLFLAAAVCLSATGCAIAPSAVTVGQSTMILRSPNHDLGRYLLDVHEATHRRQYRELGTFRFVSLYLTRPSLRYRLEAEAYATTLCTADRLPITRDRWSRLYRHYVNAFRVYTAGVPLTEEQIRAYLEEAYQDGAACPELLVDAYNQPKPSGALLWALRGMHPEIPELQLLEIEAALPQPTPVPSIDPIAVARNPPGEVGPSR